MIIDDFMNEKNVGFGEASLYLDNMKTYKLICATFGHKFSFHAPDINTANQMKIEWCCYHSYNAVDFSVEETTDQKWIHNEYFN